MTDLIKLTATKAWWDPMQRPTLTAQDLAHTQFFERDNDYEFLFQKSQVWPIFQSSRSGQTRSWIGSTKPLRTWSDFHELYLLFGNVFLFSIINSRIVNLTKFYVAKMWLDSPTKVFFFIWIFFPKHLRFTGQQGRERRFLQLLSTASTCFTDT